MTRETWRLLEAAFLEAPVLSAGGGTPDEAAAVEAALGRALPEDYREFLVRYGGGIVGPYPIFGTRLSEGMGTGDLVVEANRLYREQQWPHVHGWLIVSADGYGNPIGIADDGSVLGWDHDHAEVFPIGSSFEDFLRVAMTR